MPHCLMIAARLQPEQSGVMLMCFLFEMEGHAAAQVHEPMKANPYLLGSQESAYWITGWFRGSSAALTEL